MKAKLKFMVQDPFTGNYANKGTVFQIIEDDPKWDFVTGDFALIGNRFTMKVWRIAMTKIDDLA